DEKNIELYVNKDRYDNEFKRDIKTIVDSNNVIIIVYMRGNFYSQRFKDVTNVFYEYLNSK
ncbi:MAG: hypothetical protein LBB93_03210, partial [Elusimicrobiota bacterium]|nr:hypothetical protein [Elusimicrobiota bacterium]